MEAWMGERLDEGEERLALWIPFLRYSARGGEEAYSRLTLKNYVSIARLLDMLAVLFMNSN
jgi:hypothetical protein